MATVALKRTSIHRKLARLPFSLWQFIAGVLIVALLWTGWQLSARQLVVTVDGMQETVYTHRSTVSGLLLDLGIELTEKDRVTPSLESQLADGDAILVERARSFRVITDGRVVDFASWGTTAAELMMDAGIMIDEYDQVIYNGSPVMLNQPLSGAQTHLIGDTYANGFEWDDLKVEPAQLNIARAVPITVDDGGLPFTVRTTAQTVGEALRQAEITVYLGDLVNPSLGNEIVTGLRVSIQRSVPVNLRVDNRFVKTRTRAPTVAGALAELEIGVAGMDEVVPSLESELQPGMEIDVTRVLEEVEIEEEIAAFETVYVPDTALAIDNQELVDPGRTGITRTRYRVVYKDGEEASRVLEDRWVAQEPEERQIAYGQRIDPKVFTAPDGTQFTYWRKINMLASSYSSSTAGVSPDASYFGRTYTGDVMRHGIVAVDPSIIPLRSQVYVSDYGVGDALDRGGAIRSRRIDLGYDDSNLILWNRWVDVYLLWPPPPAHQITWVIPNWPKPPQ